MFHSMAKHKYRKFQFILISYHEFHPLILSLFADGGSDYDIKIGLPNLFNVLTEEYPSLKAQLNGKYPSLAYH